MQKVATERVAILGCIHFPFHHVKAWDATLDFLKYWKPDKVILNGDAADCEGAGRWFKEVERMSYQEEADVAASEFARLRVAVGKNTDVVLNLGNHEYRHYRLLADPTGNAERFKSVRSLQFPELFGLNRAGISVNRGKTGNYARLWLGEIQVGHFELIRKNSADTEQALVQDKGFSVISSHSHREGVYYKTLANGQTLMGIGTGCLTDPDQQTYTEDPNWQLGFVIAEKMKGKSRYHITDMPIVGGQLLFDGRLF